MSTTKYLELDSNYRNRNLPGNEQPGSFSSQISQTGIGTQITAVDPITYAYPVNAFKITEATGTFTYTIPLITTGLADSSQTKFVLSTTSGLANQNVNGYFVGAVLQVTASGTTPAVGSVYRITEWIYLGQSTSDKFMVSTDIAVPLIANTTFTIYQPSSITYTSPPPTYTWFSAPQYVFIPSSLSIPNYYSKYILFNQTQGNYTTITNFDKDTHLAQLGTDVTTLNWQADGTDVLIVRSQPPLYINNTYSFTPANATLAGIYGTVINISTIIFIGSYINGFLRFYQTGATAYTVNRISAVILLVTPRDGSASYYVTDTTGNGFSTFNNQFTTAVNTKYCVIDVSTAHPAPTINANTRCEIMGFNIDNYSPFTYNGSMASQNQSVSYDISLNSLVLPNVILSSGGRIAYYPYVYVEIENVSTTTGANKNIIYSNNPNAYRAIFKVPITDLNHPATTPFVKLTGNGMVQTMTFKPNADMKVTVRLPDGTIFTPQKSDTSYGQPPDIMLQLSMLFGMTRV